MTGMEAYDNGDYATALKEWRTLAEQGDALAQTNLGVLYAKGEGVPQDDEQAAKWFRLAAEQGNGNAQFNLGLLHDKGQGVPQDDVQAHMWFNLAAVQGNEGGRKGRNTVAETMTPAQLADAQRLAREWKPKSKGGD